MIIIHLKTAPKRLLVLQLELFFFEPFLLSTLRLRASVISKKTRCSEHNCLNECHGSSHKKYLSLSQIKIISTFTNRKFLSWQCIQCYFSLPPYSPVQVSPSAPAPLGNNYSLYFILSTTILLSMLLVSMLLVSIEPTSVTNSTRSIRAWKPEQKLQQEYFRLKLNSRGY